MMNRYIKFGLSAAITFLILGVFNPITVMKTRADNVDLSQLKIAEDMISVSGVSSGAYMAVQLHVAYSSLFMGVGSIAGGPFYCAEDMGPSDIKMIKTICMLGIGVDATAKTFIDAAEKAAAAGKIDDLANLKDDRIYIFNSMYDQVINPLLGLTSRLFYQNFVPSSQVEAWAYIKKYGPTYMVAHGMPTTKKMFDDYENGLDQITPCAPYMNLPTPSWFPTVQTPWFRGNDPWLYHCDKNGLWGWFRKKGYDLANDVLTHIYGELETPKGTDLSRMYAFKQRNYIDDSSITSDAELNAHGLGSTGYVYIPKNCQNGTANCKLHVALHGCQQFPEWTFKGRAGSDYEGKTITFDGIYRNNIYNDIAEANNIVMLYPQAHNIGTAADDINPFGCWEFWPFFDKDIENYYTKEGREMKFVVNVVTALQKGTIILSE